MTTVTLFNDISGDHKGFEISGHAGWAEKGEDIVCAAVSALSITTVNAIETYVLQDGEYEEAVDAETGQIIFMLKRTDHDTQLLIDTMMLGFKQMEERYPKYIRLKTKEVQE
jgi:hypothetical protein